MKFHDDFSKVVIEGELFSCYENGTFKDFHPVICNSELPYSTRSLNIDKQSFRYVYTKISIAGYASTLKNTSDTDNIYAGTCEKF